MEFKDFGDILGRAGLRKPSFSALHPDCSLYDVMFYQPEGNIKWNEMGVGNENAADASAKHSAFFELAAEKNASFVAVPEYSCPWAALEWTIERQFPAIGNLWVVGCESITPAELKKFRLKYEAKAKILFEEIPLSSGNFLDPVCYLFQAPKSDNSGTENVVLIQLHNPAISDR